MENRVAKKLAEEIHNKHKIMEIELDVLFPMTGGYTGKPYDDLLGLHLPEPKDFKYLWRWWARVLEASRRRVRSYTQAEMEVSRFLGGTMRGKGKSSYDLTIHDIKVFNSLIHSGELSPVDYSRVALSVNKNLGKAGISIVKESDDWVVRVIQKRNLINAQRFEDRLNALYNIPGIRIRVGTRCHLISRYFFIPEYVSLKLSIYKYSDNIKFEHLAPLILGLYLGGLGSAANRGFGSITVRDIKVSKDLVTEDERDELNQLMDFKRELDTIILRANGHIEDAIIQLMKGYYLLPSNSFRDVPPIPAIYKDNFKCYVRTPNSMDSLEILEKIGKAFLKENIRSFNRKIRWEAFLFLGGPRRSRRNRNWNRIHSKRRRSMIWVKVLADRTGVSCPRVKKIILAGLLSKDVKNFRSEYRQLYNDIFNIIENQINNI